MEYKTEKNDILDLFSRTHVQQKESREKKFKTIHANILVARKIKFH